jgi:hypothetical protein
MFCEKGFSEMEVAKTVLPDALGATYDQAYTFSHG